jgi:hemerythrin-like domain-containing protein
MSATDAKLLMASHRRLLALCSELEDLADHLPASFDPQRCLHLARAICPILAQAHALEERALFAKLAGGSDSLPNLDLSVERLRWEHFEDICFAEDLREALLALVRSERADQAETMGYMLRGFFESVRRHVAFEAEVLLPFLSSIRNANGAR